MNFLSSYEVAKKRMRILGKCLSSGSLLLNQSCFSWWYQDGLRYKLLSMSLKSLVHDEALPYQMNSLHRIFSCYFTGHCPNTSSSARQKMPARRGHGHHQDQACLLGSPRAVITHSMNTRPPPSQRLPGPLACLSAEIISVE